VNVLGQDPNRSNAIARTVGGQQIEWWDYTIVSGKYSIANPNGFNGVRRYISNSDLGYSPVKQVTSVKIHDEKTLNTYLYSSYSGTWTGILYLTSVTDAYGNVINYNYTTDSKGTYCLGSITSSSGRSVTFNYGNYVNGTNYLLSSIVLNAGGQTRTWYTNNTYTGNVGQYGLLGTVQFPTVTAYGGSQNPLLYLNYDGNGDITSLVDLNNNVWGYSYASTQSGFSPQSSGAAANVVQNVFPPAMSYQSGYNPGRAAHGYDQYNPTTFFWALESGSTYYYCLVNEPSGSWKNSEVPRGRYYEYYNGFQNGGSKVTYFRPIHRVFDADVAADGQSGALDGFFETYGWNLSDFTLTSLTDRNGNTTLWSYASSGTLFNTGLPTQEAIPGQTTAHYVGWWYDANWRVLEQVDNMNTSTGGDRTMFVYNGLTPDIAQKYVNPSASIESQYALTGSLNGVALGTYSPSNPLSIETSYTYNGNGTLASERVGTDNATSYSNYDAYGDPQTITKPSGGQWTYTYDTFGNKLSETPPASASQKRFWAYDEWNRLVKTTFGDGTSESNYYDYNSNKIETQDANGHYIYYYFDQLNRPYNTVRQTGSGSSIAESTYYDRAGDPVLLVNGNGLSTPQTFDERHHLTQTQRVANVEGSAGVVYRNYSYDGNGNVIKRFDSRGFETDQTFDPVNRPLVTTYVAANRTVNVTYQADGQRSSVTDTAWPGTWTWSYNGAKQCVQEYQPGPGQTLTRTFQVGSGRKIGLGVGSVSWTYNYDSAGRKSSVNQAIGYPTPISYAYNLDDDVSTETLGNGWSVGYTYDDLRHVTGLVDSFNSTAQQQLAYYRDSVGNITDEDRVQPTGNENSVYGYDASNRLLSESRTVGGTWPGSLGYNYTYTYDGNGNRTSVTDGLGPHTISYYTFGGYSTDQWQSGGNWTASNYDADGNPGQISNSNSDDSIEMYWNQEDQAEQVDLPGGGYDGYLYDLDGRNYIKYDSPTGTTTTYVFDGKDVVLIQAGPKTICRLPGVCEVTPGDTYPNVFELKDARGNTITETGDGGVTLGNYLYDAYGNEADLSAKPQGSTVFRFAGSQGYRYDADTDSLQAGSGLVLTGERFYLPGMGRFISPNIAGFVDGLNLYSYGQNNPANVSNPTGLLSTDQAAPTWFLQGPFLEGGNELDGRVWDRSAGLFPIGLPSSPLLGKDHRSIPAGVLGMTPGLLGGSVGTFPTYPSLWAYSGIGYGTQGLASDMGWSGGPWVSFPWLSGVDLYTGRFVNAGTVYETARGSLAGKR
jgi:RHS repeat-associated protein